MSEIFFIEDKDSLLMSLFEGERVLILEISLRIAYGYLSGPSFKCSPKLQVERQITKQKKMVHALDIQESKLWPHFKVKVTLTAKA